MPDGKRNEPRRSSTAGAKRDPQTTAAFDSELQGGIKIASGPPLIRHNLAELDIQAPERSFVLPPSSALALVGNGGGQPLPDDIRADMESRMGADLSAVRIHTDSRAETSAAAVSAEAFTVGDEIVFGAGFYAPSTFAGKRRLAHELGHVVQQRSGPVTGHDIGTGVMASEPSDPFERDAEVVAERAMRASSTHHLGEMPGAGGGDAGAATSGSPGMGPMRASTATHPVSTPRTSTARSGTPIIQRLVTGDAATADTPSTTGLGSLWLTASNAGGFLGQSDIGSRMPHDADTIDLLPQSLFRELVPDRDLPPQSPAAASETEAEVAAPAGEDIVAATQRWERSNKKAIDGSGAQGGSGTAAVPDKEMVLDGSDPGTDDADRVASDDGGATAPAEGGAAAGGAANDFGLPKMPSDIAREFLAVVTADREGQRVLGQAVERTLAELHGSVATEEANVDKDLAESTSTITGSVTKARQLVQGSAAGARAHIAKGRKEQGDRIDKQTETKKRHAHDEITRIAGEVEGVARRKADDAQKIGDDAATSVEGERPGFESTVREKVARKSQEAFSTEFEPELIQASLGGQRGAAKLVGSDTIDAIGKAIDTAARDFRSGGPRIHSENAEKVKPLVQKVLDQEGPIVATLSAAAGKAETELDGTVTTATETLQKVAQGVIGSLTQTEKQTTKNLRTAAETTKAGLHQTEQGAETALKARAAQFTSTAHSRLGQALESVSNRPMRRQLARTLSAELRSVLRHNYGMGSSQAAQVAGKIAGELSASLAQFHAELHGSTAQAADVTARSGKSGADQVSQLQRQVVSFLSSNATKALEGMDTSLTANLAQQAGIIGVVDDALAPLVDKTRVQVDGDKEKVLSDARAKIDSLDERTFEAMRKAREKAELGAFGAWLADQLRSLGKAMLTPSFWAGLLVGLLVTIFIVATFGGGLAVLVVAGAIAGALGAAASYAAQIWLDPLANPKMERQKFSAEELGKQMLIGGVFGAIGALGGGVASKVLGAELAGVTARTIFANKVAQAVAGAGLGAVQNNINGADWDEGLVTNLAVSAVMSSKLVEEHATGALGKGARNAMVDKGMAFRVEPGEFTAAQQRLEAKAEEVSAPSKDAARGALNEKAAVPIDAKVGGGTASIDAPVAVVDPQAPGPALQGADLGEGAIRAPSGSVPTEAPLVPSKTPADLPASPEGAHAHAPGIEVPEAPRRPGEEPHSGGKPPERVAEPEGAKPVQPGDPKSETKGRAAVDPLPAAEESKKVAGQKVDDTAKAKVDPKAGQAVATSASAEVNPHEPSTLLKADQAPTTPGEMALQNETGTPVATQRKLIELAQRHGVLLDVRPTNLEAPKKLAEGNLPKPEAIKAKSIIKEDLHLGFRKEDLGLVGYRMPDFPDLERIPASEHADVLKRYNQRSEEYWDLGKTMSDLQLPPDERTINHHGFDRTVQIDEHGVVRTANPNLEKGGMVGFTGDHDVFMIRDREEHQVTGKKYNEIVAELKSAGIGVEHGAHMNWEAAKNQEAGFRKIVEKHAIGAKGFHAEEHLVRFGGEETLLTPFDPGEQDPLKMAHAAAQEDKAAPNAPKEAPFQPAESKPLFEPSAVDEAVKGIGPRDIEPSAAPNEEKGSPAPVAPSSPRSQEVHGTSESVPPVRRMVDALHDEMPEHSVMMDKEPKDPAGAHTMYENSRLETPDREVAIYRNSDTGEHIVIQGGKENVSVGVGTSGKVEGPSAGDHHQAWKEILDGQKVGRWELIRHSHPADLLLPSGDRVTPHRDRVPSGRGGDLSIAEADAKRSGRPIEQKLDIRTERGDEVVSFGYDPGQERPFHVTVPDSEGTPQTTRFKSLEAYGEWYEHQFGGTPDIDHGPPVSSGQRGTGGEGESSPPATPGRREPRTERGHSQVEPESELPSHMHVEEEPEPSRHDPGLNMRVAELRKAISDFGRRPDMATHAAAELKALNDTVATGMPLRELLLSLEDKYGSSLNLVQGETTMLSSGDPEFQRIVSELANLDMGDAVSGRFADLWCRLYEEQGHLSMGPSVRKSASGSLIDSYAMRRDFLQASLTGNAGDAAELARSVAATGGAIPQAVEIVRDHLINAIAECGGAQAAVDAGLAIWVDRTTGKPTSAGKPGAVLWPSEPAGAWWIDHGVELRHGGADDVTNYVPVPYGVHLAKSKIMGQASRAVADRGQE